MFHTLRLTLSLLLSSAFAAQIASAQTSPPPTSPFTIQPPPSQSTLPSGVLPQQAPTSSAKPYVPMALPPSSGGFNPNQAQPEVINTYNMPSASPTPAPVTNSEIILFNPKPEIKTVLVVKTSEGEFKIRLKPDIAPKNVENFIDLALGQKEFIDVRTGKKVKRPFYTGLNCHRVLKSVLIQCGCPFGNGTGGPGFRVRDERSTAMKFDRPGVIAMALARAPDKNGIGYEPNSAGSQFFISLAPLPDYNGQFTVIGQVTSGMETLRKIAQTPTGPTDRPLKRVILFSIDPDLPPLAPTTPIADPSAPAADPSAPAMDPMAAPGMPSVPMNPSAVPTLPGGTIDPFAIPPPPNP